MPRGNIFPAVLKPLYVQVQLTLQSLAESLCSGILEKLVPEAALDLGSNVHIPIIKALDWV